MLQRKKEEMTKITLQIGDKEVSWASDAWDHGADELIDAFAGLMITHTFLPITVYSSLKERGEDMLNYGLSSVESRETVKELEEEIQFLKDQMFNLKNRMYTPDNEIPDTEASCEELFNGYSNDQEIKYPKHREGELIQAEDDITTEYPTEYKLEDEYVEEYRAKEAKVESGETCESTQ